MKSSISKLSSGRVSSELVSGRHTSCVGNRGKGLVSQFRFKIILHRARQLDGPGCFLCIFVLGRVFLGRTKTFLELYQAGTLSGRVGQVELT